MVNMLSEPMEVRIYDPFGRRNVLPFQKVEDTPHCRCDRIRCNVQPVEVRPAIPSRYPMEAKKGNTKVYIVILSCDAG